MTWGEMGSVCNKRYIEPRPTLGCKCGCGCGQRSTHSGMVNGVCLTTGCELSIRRWVMNPFHRRSKQSEDAAFDRHVSTAKDICPSEAESYLRSRPWQHRAYLSREKMLSIIKLIRSAEHKHTEVK